MTHLGLLIADSDRLRAETSAGRGREDLNLTGALELNEAGDGSLDRSA